MYFPGNINTGFQTSPHADTTGKIVTCSPFFVDDSFMALFLLVELMTALAFACAAVRVDNPLSSTKNTRIAL